MRTQRRNTLLGLLLAPILAVRAGAQEAPGELASMTEEVVEEMPAMVVTASKSLRDPWDLPQSARSFDRALIETVGGTVAFRALSRRDAGIWYDERTGTSTDPIIRGFAGFNLLTLVDGNTLSTLWGEGGFGADDMYGKIDPEMVERIEVVRGPNSALYGSNALGAVINVISRSSPIDYTEEGTRVRRRMKVGYESVSDTWTLRGEVFGATPDLKFLAGGSWRQFDDTKGGGDLGHLEPSDGRERNWDFSGSLRLSPGQEIRLTVQDVHRDHIKRYYRPTQDNVNDREAVALSYVDSRGGGFWDELRASIYWQKKVDERRFFDTNEKGRADTRTLQGKLEFVRDLAGGHLFTAGLHAELTEGDSPDDEQFTRIYPSPRRRAAPLSDWDDYGIFALDEWTVARDWTVTGSVRYDHQIFRTDVDDAYVPPIGNPQDDDIRDSTGAWTGGVGAVHRLTGNVHLSANYARGFRQNAPNFGLRQLGDGILIPNELLDPTTSDNFEVGVRGRWPGVSFEVAGYRSWISNWQGDLRPTTFKGQSFLDFNQNGSRDANEGYITQVEGGDAWVHGIEARADLRPHEYLDAVAPNWSLWGSFAWNEGEVDATRANPIEEPLRHTQPMRGLVGVRWDEVGNSKRAAYVEFVADMVDRFDEVSSDRALTDLAWRRDPQDGASPFLRSYIGTPGYTVFNLYAGMNLWPGATLRMGVENLTDKKYRAAHSRADAAGVSFIASFEMEF